MTQNRQVTFVQTITPEVAKKMVAEWRYDHNRPLRPSKIRDYAAAMVNGTFEELTQIYIGIYQGRHFLLDGQHRLHAVAASGVPATFTVLEREVDSAERLSQIYGRLDRNIRRGPRDIYGAYGIRDEFELSDSAVKGLGEAVSFLAAGCMEAKDGAEPESQIGGMRLYAPYMVECEAIMRDAGARTGAIKDGARRASTVAVMLLSLRFAAPKAKREKRPSVRDFWRDGFLDDGLKLGDPRKTMNKHLVETRIRSSYQGAKTVTRAYSARYLGSCLNAYLAGRELRYGKVFDENAPLDIYGVPSDPSAWW